MNRYMYILLLLSVPLLASEHSGETDIVARTFNFVIFVAILYYLVAEPIKKFLSDRKNGIEEQFNRNRIELEKSKAERDRAEENLKFAKRKAGMIVADARKEAQLIKEKLEESLKHDIEVLEQQNRDKMEIEESKMVKAVVDEVIRDIVSKSDIGLDADTLTKTLIKKVS
ncbi:MAG TPA: hypothetical protein EYG60_05110 [Campylobacterales bacterium]|nr:hypothetical protein [Campylobacterales bacterium]